MAGLFALLRGDDEEPKHIAKGGNRHHRYDRPEPDAHGRNVQDQKVNQNPKRQNKLPAFFENLFPIGKFRDRHAAHAVLKGDDVDKQIDRAEIQDRREDRDHDDFEVRHLRIFRNQERTRPHQRRGNLPACRCRSFDATGLCRTVTKPFHERNGKGTCGDHIGNRRSADRAHASRCQNGGLCRATGFFARGGIGHIDKEFTSTRNFKERAKQHEHEDIGRSNPHRQAVNAFLTKVKLPDKAINIRPAMRQNTRQPFTNPWQCAAWPRQGIDNCDNADDGHAKANRTAACFEHGDGCDDADDQIGFAPEPGAIENRIEIEGKIKAGGKGTREEGDINDPAQHTTLLVAAKNREHQEGQEHDKRQMDAALIEQAKRFDTCGVHLEQGKCNGDNRNCHHNQFWLWQVVRHGRKRCRFRHETYSPVSRRMVTRVCSAIFER